MLFTLVNSINLSATTIVIDQEGGSDDNDVNKTPYGLVKNLFYEEHEWILVSTLALNPQPIRMSCKKCGVEKF